MCKTMQCHFIYFLKKVNNLAWRYHQMVKNVPIFLLQILFNYKKIKAKFLVYENKYVCRYYKI
jgi:hypothetical protein